ncbi:MAG: hypothetical protein ABSF21_02025 [Dehalococcoidia bacterium]
MSKELVSINASMPAKPAWYQANSTVHIVIHSDQFEELAKAINKVQKSEAKRLLIEVSSVGGDRFRITLSQA